MCMVPFFLRRVSFFWKKNKTSKEEKKQKHRAAQLHPFHAWTGGSSPAAGPSHEHFKRDQEETGGEGEIIGNSAATDDYFHDRFICWVLSRLIGSLFGRKMAVHSVHGDVNVLFFCQKPKDIQL